MTAFWSKDTWKPKQQYVLLTAVALLGIILIMVGNKYTANNNKDMAVSDNVSIAGQETDLQEHFTAMEYKLAGTLSQIEGAGNVTVQITVKNSGRKEYAVDTQHTNRTSIEENADTTQRTTELQEQQTIVQQNRNGTQEALLVAETAPEILGVLVVASGADNAVVQERLLHAVAALLQLSLHQIVVLPGEGAV